MIRFYPFRLKPLTQSGPVSGDPINSFASYRLAEVKSAAQVSLEMGNSPQMIFRHYRELVSEADAKKFFSLA